MPQNVVALPKLATDRNPTELQPAPFRVSLLLPLIGLVFPPTGIVAVVFALKAKAARDDRRQMLRYAMQSRLWAQYSFGALFALLILGFIVSALVANNYAVTEGYFNLEVL